jgi:hypothetical protein
VAGLESENNKRTRWAMAFIELTRILPKANQVKCSINASNIVYFQEPIDTNTNVGCTLINVTGMDINVVESYRDVAAKFKDS